MVFSVMSDTVYINGIDNSLVARFGKGLRKVSQETPDSGAICKDSHILHAPPPLASFPASGSKGLEAS